MRENSRNWINRINKNGRWSRSPFGKSVRAIKDSPRQIFNRYLVLCVGVFALTGAPKGWDEGSCAAITSLPSFRKTFQVTGTRTTGEISNIISFVNLAAGFGAILSLFLNDRVGRLWSLRIYMFVYLTGCLVSTFSSGNVGALYFGRFWAGLGIGATSVIGTTYIVEVAPKSTRGIMTLWFNICMLTSQTIGIFVVYGVSLHISPTKWLQYQIPFLVQIFVPLIAIVLSAFVQESPRWLCMHGKYDDAFKSLQAIRKLPRGHTYLEHEFQEIMHQTVSETSEFGKLSLKHQFVEILTTRSNLRRLRLSFMSFFFAQWSGANGITNYLPLIFGLLGVKGTDQRIYSSGLYAVTKLVSCIVASACFVDIVGRRKSLLTGVSVQMCCHVYIGTYLALYTRDPAAVSASASRGAIAAIFIHAIGWSIGLYTLPYLFGSEFYPSRVRSIGTALSEGFHWWFYFAITKATPSLLKAMNNWGTFIFWAAWCAVAWVYSFVMVPETSGRSLESMDQVFDLRWYEIRKYAYVDENSLPQDKQDEDKLDEQIVNSTK
ncbi:putative transporter [Lipomyces arxii]|uniref:putative transporter n=1 Tax=Lipomyces arxii TaxID=56418 RepID=UPI0034CF4916